MAEPMARLALTPTEQAFSTQAGVELTMLDDGRKLWRITPEIASKMNLLTPISSIVQVDANWTPIPKAISLRPDIDTFKVGFDSKTKEEIHSIMGTALAGLADVCGIETVGAHTVRFDGGMEVFIKARMRRPDGLWTVIERSADVYFEDHAEKVRLDALERWEKWDKGKGKPQPSETDLRKLVLANKEFLGRTLQSKAFNRCVRGLLQIRALPKSAFNKPFLGVAWFMTPDFSKAGTRQLVQLQYHSAEADLYGDEPVDEVLELAGPEGTSLVVDEQGQVVDIDDVDEFDLPGSGEEADFERIEQPSSGFKISASHPQFGGQHVRDVVKEHDGWKVVAQLAKGSSSPERQQLALDWLSWASQDNVGLEDL